MPLTVEAGSLLITSRSLLPLSGEIVNTSGVGVPVLISMASVAIIVVELPAKSVGVTTTV